MAEDTISYIQLDTTPEIIKTEKEYHDIYNKWFLNNYMNSPSQLFKSYENYINIIVYKEGENYDGLNNIYYGICEDCSKIGKLVWRDACSDSACNSVDCCKKRICSEYCNVFCNNGHLIKYQNITGEINKELICHICNDTLMPSFKWFGLSIIEHIDRYG